MSDTERSVKSCAPLGNTVMMNAVKSLHVEEIDIRNCGIEDPVCVEVQKAMAEQKPTVRLGVFTHETSLFTDNNGLLYYKGRIVVPEMLVRPLVTFSHYKEPRTKHLGIRKTIKALRRCFL